MGTHVVLNDLESTVIQLGLEVLKSASPSALLNEQDNAFYRTVIDEVLEKIDTATKLQHPIIEV